MIAAAFAGHLRAGRSDWRGVSEFAGRCTNRASSVSPTAGVCYPRHLQSIPIKLTLFNRRSGTPMRKRIVFATFLLSTCCVFGGNGFGQEARKPFTKQEILRLLKPTPGTRYEQGNLAGEISQRGIDFPADEKGLSSPDSLSTATEEAQRDAPKIDVAKLPLLDQARNHAAEFMDDLPKFVVTQIVTRSVRTPKKRDWQQQDKLEIELSYRAKTGEQFKLVRYNDKTTQMTYDQLKGATTAGEFGSILGALFSPESQAEFKEVRRETFHGHQTVIYD